MREHLLGYLLNALDEQEHEQVEKQLHQDEQLQSDLKRLSGRLNAFGSCRAHEDPPLGLASRTCQLIQQSSLDSASLAPVDAQVTLADKSQRENSPAAMTDASLSGAGGGSRWSMADVIVASGVMVASALLFFPAIANSRYQAELAGCQNNLRQLGVALSEYSQQNGDVFPPVPESGNLSVAGAYAPTLVSDNFVTNPKQMICPGSPLAANASNFRVPSLQEVDQASGEPLRQLQKNMGGSYGYAFGYVDEGGQYRNHRNQHREHFALMSDAPCLDNDNGSTRHHGGRGQNVLFESGRVKLLPGCQEKGLTDQLFRSDRGLVEAGRHQNDTVIGPSGASPFSEN